MTMRQMVFDKVSLDYIPSALAKTLPPDFHVQLLLRDLPRVRCQSNAMEQARVYCWDCENPFLSIDESNRRHVPEIKYDGAGLPYLDRDGPVHRFHPLIEEDCSTCLASRLKLQENVLGSAVVKHDGGLRLEHQADQMQIRQVCLKAHCSRANPHVRSQQHLTVFDVACLAAAVLCVR